MPSKGSILETARKAAYGAKRKELIRRVSKAGATGATEMKKVEKHLKKK